MEICHIWTTTENPNFVQFSSTTTNTNQAKIIYLVNKGQKLTKENQSLPVKSGSLVLPMESWLQTQFSCFLLLNPFKDEKLPKNPTDPLMRSRTPKLCWDFKVFENILHIMAWMEKHSNKKIGRIFLKKPFIQGFNNILCSRKAPSLYMFKKQGKRREQHSLFIWTNLAK